MAMMACRDDCRRRLGADGHCHGRGRRRACIRALEADDHLLISAGTVAEALIVADRRDVGEEMDRLISELGFEVVSVTAAAARRVARAYETWGKGIHPAGLNLGDCFAYEVAKEHACPLLYVGHDFSKTDIEGVF